MEKKIFYTEAAYVLGIICLSCGASLMERADFGLSMVVAPAYLLHLKISQFLPFFSFGMAEYTFQAFLLIVMIIVLRRFRVWYLFSFVTAVFYGVMLDVLMALVGTITADMTPDMMWGRLILYVLGLIACAVGVSLIFHTYISPEVYELFVKEVSAKFGADINRFKTGYDCVSCIISVAMSFTFFGLWQFEGVKLGTIFCALINGTMIGLCSRGFEKHFVFKDGLKLRKYFERETE